MSDWQPIATAPRDGTMILLYDAKMGEGPWAGAYNVSDKKYPWMFFDDIETINTDEGDLVRPNGWPDDHRGPTHWMPLPEPPK